MKVLVVDDSESSRQLAIQCLRKYGVSELFEAENGRRAMEIINPSFDLVLTDWVMPQMDGGELLSAIKQDEALKNIHVVIMTTQSDFNAVINFLEAGASDFVGKPFSYDDLAKALERLESKTGKLETSASTFESRKDKLDDYLKRENEFQKQVLSILGELVMVLDSKGDISRVNTRVCEHFNKTESEICGRPYSEFIDGDVPELDLLSFRCELRNVRVSLVSGTQRTPVLASSSFLKTASGEFLGLVLCLTDISKEMDLQAKLINLEKWRSVGEMASGIAHEINNPLGVIIGFAEKIQLQNRRGDIDKEDLDKTCEKILTHGDRIVEIINGLRTVSRDGNAGSLQEISVAKIVNDAANLCQGRLSLSGMQFILSEIPDDIEVNCNATQIGQVIVNLVNNAYDAVKGQEDAWIKIGYEIKEGKFVLSVSNSGEKIPDLVKDKIFDPFFSTKDVNEGTGLGLSISRSIVERHGGKLVLNESCEFTRFDIILNHSSGKSLDEAA